MEFRQLIIAQKETQKRFVFNNKINLVTSTQLSDELLKPNYDLKESSFYIEDQEDGSLSDLFQIKVRIASTGIVMVNFPKELLSIEQKEELVKEIGTLKDNVAPSEQAQKEKISKLFDIIIKYNPLFVAYTNTGDFIFTRLTFEEILNGKEVSFPLLLLLTSLGFADDISSKDKKISPKPVVKNSELKSSSQGFDFKAFFLQFKNLDFVFFGEFSFFIAFGILASGFELINNEGFSAFLIVLTVAFVIILNFITYKSYKDEDTFTYKLDKLIVPLIYVIVGVGLGILVGYLVTTFLLKANEDIVVNYGALYGVSIALAIVLSIASLFTPILTSKIAKKIKGDE